MFRSRIKFYTVGILISQHMTGKFYDRHLHSKADAKVRDFVNTGILCCQDHSFGTSVSKSSRNQDTIHLVKHLIQIFLI